jgi:hypothetical protein
MADMSEYDFVRSIRIPRELYDRIRAWTETQQPQTSLGDGIRYVLERGMKDIERSRRSPKE